jgi:hypothetical protein
MIPLTEAKISNSDGTSSLKMLRFEIINTIEKNQI